jgi:hypothetical protein
MKTERKIAEVSNQTNAFHTGYFPFKEQTFSA